MSISIWIQCSRTDVFASELNFILRLYKQLRIKCTSAIIPQRQNKDRGPSLLAANPFHEFAESRYTFGITTCPHLKIAGAAICLKKNIRLFQQQRLSAACYPLSVHNPFKRISEFDHILIKNNVQQRTKVTFLSHNLS